MTTSEPAPAERARILLRSLDRAALATLDADGAPYASLVLVATDPAGQALLLISRLAEHTGNLEGDARAALLFDGTAGFDQPLTGPRLTVSGRAEPVSDPALHARYLARHPDAAAYAGFPDFSLWRVRVERGHMVAGFGAIHRLDATDLLINPPPTLTAAEPGILAHMNEDHADAVDLYAQALLGRTGSGWRMTGIDADGADLRLGAAVARLAFAARVTDAESARKELARLVRHARGGGLAD
ncbi:pyridoxamine 5'-phosphate oxidase family protein [Inquilinus limosus]|uniref:HugZ family pyridoxamine 5'-phosphate oxidase n=1 Tax=Inquilinus limosus TaxID=171674 RepID=UPI003F146ABD